MCHNCIDMHTAFDVVSLVQPNEAVIVNRNVNVTRRRHCDQHRFYNVFYARKFCVRARRFTSFHDSVISFPFWSFLLVLNIIFRTAILSSLIHFWWSSQLCEPHSFYLSISMPLKKLIRLFCAWITNHIALHAIDSLSSVLSEIGSTHITQTGRRPWKYDLSILSIRVENPHSSLPESSIWLAR